MKKKAKKRTRPRAYDTMPYYFPTEQVDIVKKKMKPKRRLRRKNTK